MVTAFLRFCHGFLRLSQIAVDLGPISTSDSAVIMYPGVNKDKYCTSDYLARQTKQILRIFESCILISLYRWLMIIMKISMQLRMTLGLRIVCRSRMEAKMLVTSETAGTRRLMAHAWCKKMARESGKRKGVRSILQERVSLF